VGSENHDGFQLPFEGPGVLPKDRPLRRRSACVYCDLGFGADRGIHRFPKNDRPCGNAGPSEGPA
jgi:hypothetical protein